MPSLNGQLIVFSGFQIYRPLFFVYGCGWLDADFKIHWHSTGDSAEDPSVVIGVSFDLPVIHIKFIVVLTAAASGS